MDAGKKLHFFICLRQIKWWFSSHISKLTSKLTSINFFLGGGSFPPPLGSYKNPRGSGTSLKRFLVGDPCSSPWSSSHGGHCVEAECWSVCDTLYQAVLPRLLNPTPSSDQPFPFSSWERSLLIEAPSSLVAQFSAFMIPEYTRSLMFRCLTRPCRWKAECKTIGWGRYCGKLDPAPRFPPMVAF